VRRHLRLVLVTLAAALIVLTLAPLATAQDETPRIAVQIEGPKADSFREMILGVVPPEIEVIEPFKFRSALAQKGLPGGKMGFSLTSQRQRPTLLKIASKAVKSQKLAGVLLGRVRAGRKGIELVAVYQEADGEPRVDDVISLKGSREEQQERVLEAMGAIFDELAPKKEEEPEEEPEEKPEEEEEDEEEEDEEKEEGEFEPNQIGSELFNLSVGVEVGGRFFSYSESEANTTNLRPYDVFGVPGINVAGEIYPLATLGITAASDIGVTAEYMHAFGLDSETADGTLAFGTNWERFRAGLRYRLRIGDKGDNPVVIGIEARVGIINFSFDADNPASAAIINEIGTVDYLFIEPKLDARIPILEWFHVGAHFGYAGVLGAGDDAPAECQDPVPTDPVPPPDCLVYERFRAPEVHGLDMGAYLAFVMGYGFEARAGLDYMRYFSSFAPEPGDDYVAGGALDEYLSIRVGIGYVF
jgi:hypothetical protein